MEAVTWYLVGAAALLLSFVSIGVRGSTYSQKTVVQIVSSVAAIYLWVIFAVNGFSIQHIEGAVVYRESNPGLAYFGFLWVGVMLLDLFVGVMTMVRDR